MELLEAVSTRKSIRGYTDKEVSKDLVCKILEQATRCSSAMNTQVWKFIVVTKDVLNAIGKDNCDSLLNNKLAPQEDVYKGVYSDRRGKLGKDVFEVMGIDRKDREKRMDWTLRGYRFFDAPVAIILASEKEHFKSKFTLFDLGGVAQTIALVAKEYGLGTCIEVQGVDFPDVIRKHTGIPEDWDIAMGIAMGYPDPDYPANKLETERAAVDDVACFYGF